ncbi:MAG: hypothetical protein JO131_09675 [Gammaproteobacteria bacterium]|nr:hypothetical protein [Gammaproteobacteria bacterium]
MLLDTLFGYMKTQCLYVAVKLKISDYLSSGDKSISELSELTKSNPEALYRVMRCLAAQGIYKENDNYYFSQNNNSERLITYNPEGLSDFIIFCAEELFFASSKLLQTIQTGKTAFDQYFKINFWDYLESHPEKSIRFNTAMEQGYNYTAESILKTYDFSKQKYVIDIGGGKGHLLCSILNKYMHIHGTVYDLPQAIEQTKQYIKDRKLQNRCETLAGNFFNYIPPNGDMYLLRVILHDWNDAEAIKILLNCYKAMKKSSVLIIIEKVLQKNNIDMPTYLGDINMLISLTGKERTYDEYKILLEKSNFKLAKFLSTNTPYSIIEAIPNK